MAKFNTGLEFTVTGDTQIKHLLKIIQTLGGEVDTLNDEIIQFGDTENRVLRGAIQNWNKLGKTGQRVVKEAIEKLQKGNKNLGASFTELNPQIDDVVKVLKKLERQELAAADAAKKFDKSLENALIKANALQQQKIGNANLVRNANRAADAQEFDRRLNERRQDDQNRYNRQLQTMQQRHQMAMNRINAYQRGGGGPMGTISAGLGNGAIVKVLAYDALRRTLTNIYQTMGKIGDTIQEWTVGALEFNDEMRRSETVFTTMAMSNLKNKNGERVTISEAANSGDANMQRSLAEAKGFSKGMMDELLKSATMTGQDVNEIVASARQALPDLINKMTTAGVKDPVKTHSAELIDVVNRMTKIGSILKMSDPMGKKLSWHMVPLLEIMSGTSGGGKDKGMEAVRSLRTREGIRVNQADASKIAKAVNAGKIADAFKAVEEVMAKSGITITTAINQLNATIMANMDAVKTAFNLFGTKFTQSLYDGILGRFMHWRIKLLSVIEDKTFDNRLIRAGELFGKAFDPLMLEMSKFMEWFTTKPKEVEVTLQRVSAIFAASVPIFVNLGMAFVNFMSGFLGLSDGKLPDISSIEEFTKQLRGMGEEAGIQAKKISDDFLEGIRPITENLIPIMVQFASVVEFLASAIKPAMEAISMLVNKLLSMPGISNFFDFWAGKDVMDQIRLQTNVDGTDTANVINDAFSVAASNATFFIPGASAVQAAYRGVNEIPQLVAANPARNSSFDKSENIFTVVTSQMQEAGPKPNQQKNIFVLASNVANNNLGNKTWDDRRFEQIRNSRNEKQVEIANSPIFNAIQTASILKQNPGNINLQQIPEQYKYLGRNMPKISQDAGMDKNKIMQVVEADVKRTSTAIVETIKTGRRPIEFKSGKVEQKYEIHIGSITLDSDDPQEMFNKLVQMGKGKAPSKGKALPYGPISPGYGASIGVTP